MTEPSPNAAKSEWRSWARSLEPVPSDVAARVSDHVDAFVRSVGGLVLGYEALPDEVAIDVRFDAIATLDEDRQLTIGDLPVDEIAVVLVPARVFDRDGYRLGRGGGHYDRLLPELRAGTPVLGVTCAARLVERLPREPHDVPMTHLATEHGVHETNSTRQHADTGRHLVENGGGAELDS